MLKIPRTGDRPHSRPGNRNNGNLDIRTGHFSVMLDYGEVLCFLPTPDAIARMARIFRIDPGTFLALYIKSRGPMTGETFN